MRAIKYSVGRAPSKGGGLPVFNDLASARGKQLIDRTGLCRAIELVRFIAPARAGEPPHLVIDDPRDLADPWDRAIVAVLVEAVGSRLVIAGERFDPYSVDEDEVVEVLRLFASPSPDGQNRNAYCHYLHNRLGLTGTETALVLNAAEGSDHFTAQRVLSRASKRVASSIDSFIDAFRAVDAVRSPLKKSFDELFDVEAESANVEPASTSPRPNLAHLFLHAGVQVVGAPPTPLRQYALERYAAAVGNDRVKLPGDWEDANILSRYKQRLNEAIPLIAQVAVFSSSRFTHEPTSRKAAAEFANARRAEGLTSKQIAERLNDEGYLVTRGGVWHRQTVDSLLKGAGGAVRK